MIDSFFFPAFCFCVEFFFFGVDEVFNKVSISLLCLSLLSSVSLAMKAIVRDRVLVEGAALLFGIKKKSKQRAKGGMLFFVLVFALLADAACRRKKTTVAKKTSQQRAPPKGARTALVRVPPRLHSGRFGRVLCFDDKKTGKVARRGGAADDYGGEKEEKKKSNG